MLIGAAGGGILNGFLAYSVELAAESVAPDAAQVVRILVAM